MMTKAKRLYVTYKLFWRALVVAWLSSVAVSYYIVHMVGR